MNKELARTMGLKPGVKVVHRLNGVRSPRTEYVIRTVNKDGVVFLEGRHRAWPMDLEKVSENGSHRKEAEGWNAKPHP